MASSIPVKNSLLFICLALLASCMDTSVPLYFMENRPENVAKVDFPMGQTEEIKIVEEPQLMMSDDTSYKKLVEIDNYASCYVLAVYDEENRKIEVPEEVAKELDCPVVAQISPDFRFLIYGDLFGVSCYSFSTKTIHPLVTFETTNEGVSGPCWSPDRNKIMLVTINQQGYKEHCRIFVLTLGSDGALEGKQRFGAFVNYECGSVCGSFAGRDFWFEDDNTVKYRRHEEAQENPGEIFSIELE
ncbi:MAG: hypothetical protein ABIJ16_03825 [Bacteroidota bacterium]